jgi:hypothetical protein
MNQTPYQRIKRVLQFYYSRGQNRENVNEVYRTILKNKKKMKQLALLLVLVLISCGAKKVRKEQTKIDSTSTTIVVIKTDSAVKETKNIKFDVTTDDITIEALDTAKPIEITNSRGKVIKYKNAILRHKKVKNNTIVVNDKTIDKKVVNSSENDTRVVKVHNKKAIKKEQFNWSTFILQFLWLWLLLLIIIYYGYKKATKL